MVRCTPVALALVIITSCGHEAPSTVATPVTDVQVEEDVSDASAEATASTLVSGLVTNPFDWEVVPTTEDPFAPEAPITCEPEAHGPEEITGVWVYSLDTEACSWLTVRQRTVLALQPGDRLRAGVFHFALTAPTDATAHVGLAWSDEVIVTVDEPIPSAGRLVTLEYTVERAHPAGEELFFHIDNHGANSWHLLEIRLNPPEEAR
ncbi:MAG: hypothetical protein ACPGU1_08255 [Myxococcota bacterium]